VVTSPSSITKQSEFEPLVQIVYDHMKSKEFDKYDYPFSLHENPEFSKRYAEAYGKQVFEGRARSIKVRESDREK